MSECSCETCLLVLQCRETGTTILLLNKQKTYLGWEGRKMFFLLSFRKLVLKQRLEVSVMAKKMHPLAVPLDKRSSSTKPLCPD